MFHGDPPPVFGPHRSPPDRPHGTAHAQCPDRDPRTGTSKGVLLIGTGGTDRTPPIRSWGSTPPAIRPKSRGGCTGVRQSGTPEVLPSCCHDPRNHADRGRVLGRSQVRRRRPPASRRGSPRTNPRSVVISWQQLNPAQTERNPLNLISLISFSGFRLAVTVVSGFRTSLTAVRAGSARVR